MKSSVLKLTMTHILTLLVTLLPIIFICNATYTTEDESKVFEYDEPSKTTSKNFSSEELPEKCNITFTHESENKLSKRSVEYLFSNSSKVYTTTTEAPDLSMYSEEFLSCSLSRVEPECYSIFKNGTIHVPAYKRVFDKRNYIFIQNALHICPEFFPVDTDKFTSSIEILSLVCTIISAVAIVLHITMFALVKKMRNFPGYCLLSLCFALLLAYICFTAQFNMSGKINCRAIGMIVYFCFLASFFWMNVMAYDVWQSIRLSITKLRRATDRPVLIRFALYSCYAWGSPMLIIVAAKISDHLSSDVQYKLIFHHITCWFQYRKALLLYFGLPIFIILCINILLFISSFYMVTKYTMSFKSGSSKSDIRSDLRSRLFLSLRLGSAMGLMWIFGVLAAVTGQQWIFYLSSVCNALQGLFIFFSFTVNEKTIKACKKISQCTTRTILPEPFPKASFVHTNVQSS